MVLTHREHWATLKCTNSVQTLRLCPGKSGLLLLDALGTAYDNYRLLSLVVEVKGVGPTTSSDTIAWALDYSVRDVPASRTQILAKVPSLVQPAYRSGVVMASSQRLMRQTLYNTNTADKSDDSDACLFVAIGNSNSQLELWEVYASYKVKLVNPSPKALNG